MNRASIISHGLAIQFKVGEGWRPNDSLLAKLVFSNTAGKSAIGFEFALKNVLSLPQSGNKEICEAGKSLREVLKRKGNGKSWVLPVFRKAD